MKRRLFSVIFLLTMALGLLSFAYVQAQQRRLAGKLIRLHVVANSDSAADQALKLEVRDAVLAAAQSALTSGGDPAAALAARLEALEGTAAGVLREHGSADRAVVTLQNERFPTRDYETFSLPAGVYRTLRVTIGSGEGHNWWCVVFPSICMAASLDDLESAAVSGGFSEEEVKLITGADGGYVLKFKTLEWLEKLKTLLWGA